MAGDMRCHLGVSLFRLLPAILLLTGCARRETPVVEGIRTQTLHVGNRSEPETLDPHLLTSIADMNVALALYEGLTGTDEKTALAVPGVAERWEVSPDGLVYTFHLRHNARWSNGDPVTARDFAFSLQRILTPSLGSTYSYMLWPIRNAEAFNAGKLTDFAEVGVRMVDDFTLRITLTQPTPYLPMLAAHTTWMPVHRASVEKAGRSDDRRSAWAQPGRLVGNGAFTLATWQANARIVLDRNPHYWGAADNRLAHVVLYPTEQPEVEELNYRAGQLHITFSLPPSKIPVYRQQAPGELRIDPQLRTVYLNFNNTKPPLNNPKVRQALARAINRPAISERVYNGARPSAYSWVPPGAGGYVPATGPAFDFAAARALLAEAGYPGGQGLPVMAVQVLNDNVMPKVAEAIQAMWQRELGLRVTIEPFEGKTWVSNQQSLSHTMSLAAWTADYPDPTTFLDIFRAGGGNNWTGWASREYDALLDQAGTTTNPTTRFALLQKAEAIMLADAAMAPLIFDARTYLVHPAVKNWEPSPLGVHRFQVIRLEN